MKFCSNCAHPITVGIPPNDHLPRCICTHCGAIHYKNPKIVVCSIPAWGMNDDVSVLLCKRAIEPRSGYWTLPGGFMENNETTKDAAFRETEEEAGAQVEVDALFSLMNLPTAQQVHLFYRARLLNLDYSPGTESLQVQLFREHEIPWDQLAFSTIKYALELFFSDQKKLAHGGSYGFHSLDLKQLFYPD